MDIDDRFARRGKKYRARYLVALTQLFGDAKDGDKKDSDEKETQCSPREERADKAGDMVEQKRNMV